MGRHWSAKHLFWVAVFLSGVFAQAYAAAQDSFWTINSQPGSCIEAADGDTIYVPAEATLFGRQISFCPEQIGEAATPAQILIMLDKSGSMALLDPLRDAWTAYQQFVDSINANSPQSMVGLITYGSTTPGGSDYWVSVYRPLQVGIGPNLATIKSWVYRDSIVGSTPWGPALDSAYKVFGELPPNDNRQIVFLSDGEPTGQAPQAAYFDALNRIGQQLPPVHTIYFFNQVAGGWDPTRSWFLDSLAGLTGGTYTEAGSRTDLYSAFLDSILGRISFRAKLEDFYISNSGSEQYLKFQSTETGGATTLVTFPPVNLVNGINPITFFYLKKGDVLDITNTQNITKVVYVIRKTGPLSTQEQAAFNQTFQMQYAPKPSIGSTRVSAQRLNILALAGAREGLNLSINLPAAGPYTLSLFNAAGVRLWAYRSHSESAGRFQVELGHQRGIKNGLYLARLRQGNAEIVRRFAVIR